MVTFLSFAAKLQGLHVTYIDMYILCDILFSAIYPSVTEKDLCIGFNPIYMDNTLTRTTHSQGKLYSFLDGFPIDTFSPFHVIILIFNYHLYDFYVAICLFYS